MNKQFTRYHYTRMASKLNDSQLFFQSIPVNRVFHPYSYAKSFNSFSAKGCTLINNRSSLLSELQLKTDRSLPNTTMMVITTAQLHSVKPELRFYAGSNPARGVSKTRHGEYLSQWSPLGIRLNSFRRSAISQKQFIITFTCDDIQNVIEN